MNDGEVHAWETEDAEMVVWGTHDVELAEAVFAIYWAMSGCDESDAPTYQDWARSRAMWADPSLVEEEVWGKDQYSDSEVEGWVPYMILEWEVAC